MSEPRTPRLGECDACGGAHWSGECYTVPAVAAALAELRAKVERLTTHEATGEVEWLCIPDPRYADGPMAHFSVDCGNYAAHHCLIDGAAVLALLDPA